MIVETFPVGMLQCNCTILGDEASGEAIVIDGGDEVAEIARRLDARGLKPRWLVHTHAHIDHIGALGPLRERVGGAGLLHHADRPLYATLAEQALWLGLVTPPEVVGLDGDLADGDVLRAGALALRCVHTPGHTPGSTSFALDAAGATTLFTGDTLFAGSVGRWDLGGTSLEDIVASIRRKLLVHDDASVVVPGHGPSTTIGLERRTNPFLLP
ncbi:MAG TPA: MBL fold metallo-hydrolase [Candidatus Baltobacteraceae bacterium]|nr:MBL fold metallo-hydrolase [Candidatus Baltobacteraceae bacterium]